MGGSRARAWIAEIRAAQLDAAEAIPFGAIAGHKIAVSDLFQLAPMVALKFRGLAATRRNVKLATNAALGSYAATTSASPGLARLPTVIFAFAYLASHYGLDLVSEAEVNRVMDYIADHPAMLLAPTSPAEGSRGPRRPPRTLGLAPPGRSSTRKGTSVHRRGEAT